MEKVKRKVRGLARIFTRVVRKGVDDDGREIAIADSGRGRGFRAAGATLSAALAADSRTWRGGGDGTHLYAEPGERVGWSGCGYAALPVPLYGAAPACAGSTAIADGYGGGGCAGGCGGSFGPAAIGGRQVHGRENDFAGRGGGVAAGGERPGVLRVSAASAEAAGH